MNISPGSVTKQKERSKDEKYSDLEFFLALMNGMTMLRLESRNNLTQCLSPRGRSPTGFFIDSSEL